MKQLEDRIRADGKVLEGGVLTVDSFLNHQIDTALQTDMAAEFCRLFAGEEITKVLTVEASGIGIACAVGTQLGVPVLFAKKSKTKNVSGEVYTAQVGSFTHGGVNTVVVSKRYLLPHDRVLLIDDFLANGEALRGLISLASQAGATVVGAGVCVEKTFQPGGDELRSQGLRIEALARIASMSPESGVVFC